MATLYGVNAAKVLAPTAANRIDQGYIKGRVRCLADYYIGLGTEANLDVIKIGAPLPIGAKILSGVISITACGGTFGLGDAVNATRYGSILADNAISYIDEVLGFQYTIVAGTVQVILTCSAAVTAAGRVNVTLFYTCD